MKYNKYIISFRPGSSGRFIKSLLDRIIMGSINPVEICPFNSSHLDESFTGISISDIHAPDIYNILTYEFTNPELGQSFSKIFATHTYPDFETINTRFDDIGIILIKPDHDDAKEIVFNSIYKNKNEMLSPLDLEIKSHKIVHKMKSQFFHEDDYPENCLVLKYKEIYEKVGEKYRILEILKEFTGIQSVPDHLTIACEQYISNRAKIINQYNLR